MHPFIPRADTTGWFPQLVPGRVPPSCNCATRPPTKVLDQVGQASGTRLVLARQVDPCKAVGNPAHEKDL